MSAKPAPNRSLQQKSAARMAAVQCLYRRKLTRETMTSARLLEDYKAQLASSGDERKKLCQPDVTPNYALALKLLNGVSEYEDTIARMIGQSLKSGWSRERMSPLLLAILECGTFEMLTRGALHAGVIVSEYAALTSLFLGAPEVGFVSAALHKTAETP